MKKLEISQSDLKHNLEVVKNLIKKANSNAKIIAVVKANGMGLDLIKYANFFVENGIEMLAVANVDEALVLRKAGITCDILMLTPVSQKKELQSLLLNDITLTIGSYNELETAEEVTSSLNKKASAHIKIDTGFGRYGFLYSEKEIILKTLKKANNIKIKGIYTHFSNAINENYTRTQFYRFIDVTKSLSKNGYNIGLLHCSASTAFLKYPEMMLDAVRIRISYSG